jgi:cytochrome c
VTRKRAWTSATLVAALSLVVAASALAGPAANPGKPENGRKIFQKHCARCHNFMATGTQASARPGVHGSDLDVLKPRYSRIVAAIVQGEGGLPAEYFLLRLTFQEIYDVAAFVAKYAGKPAPHVVGAKATAKKTTTR